MKQFKNNRNWFVSVCISVLFASVSTKDETRCGNSFGSGRNIVVNGEAQMVGDSPWHVAIYSNATSKSWDLICGATIISENLIVSAAHCFRDYFGNPRSESNYEAVVAKLNRPYNLIDSNQTKSYKIKKIFYPPIEYLKRSADMYHGDIALLQTFEKITFSKFVLPVCLDWTSSGPFIPTQTHNGKLVGWGQDASGKPSNVLLASLMTFVDKSRCKELVSSDFQKTIKEDKFCAANWKGAGAQPGDSGGGLLFRNMPSDSYFIYGIVSTKDTTTVSIATFTDIGMYVDWIGNVAYEMGSQK